MIVRIISLFFSASICIAGNARIYYPISQVYVYQPQRCASGYCSQEYHFPATSGVQFIQPPFDGITQQGNRKTYYFPKPDHHINQPQKCLSGYCYDKSTSPPTFTSTAPPVQVTAFLAAPLYLQQTALSASTRISEKKCYETYIPRKQVPFVAGGDLTTPGEFPHMAAIGYRRQKGDGFEYQCGGTLISSMYILTAAHCRSVKGQSPAVARIGGARLDDKAKANQPQEIASVIVHPNYTRKQVYDDIALIKLRVGSSYNPACLWTKNDINYDRATAIGYGQTELGLSTSTDLLKVDLQLYSSQVCKAYYTPRYRVERGLIGSQICAGDFSRVKDTCPGDSGGPLLARTKVNDTEIPFILGVTSFGPGCAQGTPGVYTKVSSYLDWIEPIVWAGE